MWNKHFKTYFIFIMVVCLVMFFPNLIHAHVLKSDNDVGAVLHIEPKDEPDAGIESFFYFDIKSIDPNFKVIDCLCIFKVSDDNKEIYYQPLTQTIGTTVIAKYIFPKKNIYKIELSGKSTSDSFKPFHLSYDIEVGEKLNDNFAFILNKIKSFKYLSYLILGIICFGLLTLFK